MTSRGCGLCCCVGLLALATGPSPAFAQALDTKQRFVAGLIELHENQRLLLSLSLKMLAKGERIGARTVAAPQAQAAPASPPAMVAR